MMRPTRWRTSVETIKPIVMVNVPVGVQSMPTWALPFLLPNIFPDPAVTITFSDDPPPFPIGIWPQTPNEPSQNPNRN